MAHGALHERTTCSISGCGDTQGTERVGEDLAGFWAPPARRRDLFHRDQFDGDTLDRVLTARGRERRSLLRAGGLLAGCAAVGPLFASACAGPRAGSSSGSAPPGTGGSPLFPPADGRVHTVESSEQTVRLTDFKDPAPILRKIKKQLVTYKRTDGTQCSFTLYLPPDYKEGVRYPTIVYAYPAEFTDPNVAGQIGGSPQRFTTLRAASHLFLLLSGYVILNDATMPIVGDPETVNNTYVEQLTMSAKAAIDKAAEMGVTDPARVGVTGHSYGGFMTANLLAHTDLFRAGVARSGAYNRTLTPFGFQNERRTYWEAPDVYMKMSPFNYADKIKEPILLIHGEADDNTGTFPIQSERLYQAIRGNGGTVRLVMLPSEPHGYSAQESLEHVLWETQAWFDKYLK